MGVSYLLDTHVLLWVLTAPERVPPRERGALADASSVLYVSSASAMEVATKVRLGRLDAAQPLVTAWSERVAQIGATELAISSAHSVLAGSLSWTHRDPFDRFLVAQALRENLTLVTVDRAMVDFPGLATLTW